MIRSNQSEDLQKIADRFDDGEKYLAEWRRDPALRLEFTSFESFAYFKWAIGAGRARIMGQK